MDRRRTLLALLALGAAPPYAGAGAPKRVVMLTGGASPEGVATARRRMVDLLAAEGLVHGRDFVLEDVNIDERDGSFPGKADEIVASRPDAIAVVGTAVAKVFQARTDRIPIVFRSVGDPVGAGLVRSLARPGGNITGESNQSMFLEGKRLQLLRELRPGLRRVLLVTLEGPGADLARERVAGESQKLGIRVFELTLGRGVSGTDDSRLIFARFAEVRAEAIQFAAFHPEDPNTTHVLSTLQARGIPAMFMDHRVVRKGGLISLGVRQDVHDPGPYRILARVLRGEHPSNIPVIQTLGTHMAVNLRTARAMQIRIPDSIWLSANEYVE